MKSQRKSEERALGYVAVACYALSLALCAAAGYTFVVLSAVAARIPGWAGYMPGAQF